MVGETKLCNLGEFVLRKRKELGFSQRKLARLINVSNTTIYKIESGEIQTLKPEIVRGLVDVLDVNVNKLLQSMGVEVLEKREDIVQKEMELWKEQLLSNFMVNEIDFKETTKIHWNYHISYDICFDCLTFKNDDTVLVINTYYIKKKAEMEGVIGRIKSDFNDFFFYYRRFYQESQLKFHAVILKEEIEEQEILERFKYIPVKIHFYQDD